MKNISRISIFADHDLPRKLDDAKISHFTVNVYSLLFGKDEPIIQQLTGYTYYQCRVLNKEQAEMECQVVSFVFIGEVGGMGMRFSHSKLSILLSKSLIFPQK